MDRTCLSFRWPSARD